MIRVIDDYLEDILQECNYLLKRSTNLTYGEFIENEDLKRAFVRSLEIIGEAAKKIPQEISLVKFKIKGRDHFDTRAEPCRGMFWEACLFR